MTAQTEQTPYPVRPQIISVWTTRKTCLIIEDATTLDDPKLRFAILPAADNEQPVCDFYLNVHEARALFKNLTTGRLADAASKSNKKQDPSAGFDRYAKLNGSGHRTLTIANKNEEVGILVVKQTGNKKNYQKVYLKPFEAQTIALAVLAYLSALDATSLARVYGKEVIP